MLDEISHSAEHRERIWEAHWQVPGEHRRGGGGLGLAIARGIAEAHGGRIWVESTVGEGTTFFFTVPVRSPPLKGAERS